MLTSSATRCLRSRFHLINWLLATCYYLYIFNKALAMLVRARVVRYWVTLTASQRRLIGSLVRLTSLYVTFWDRCHSLACALSVMSVFSAVFLFRDYLVPLTVRYCLVLCFRYLVSLACGSSIASRSFIAGRFFIVVVYFYVYPIYRVIYRVMYRVPDF